MNKHQLQIAAAILTILFLLMAMINISEYGYYQFLRMWVTLTGGCLCYFTYKTRKHSWSIVFSIIMVLFNPIYTIYLEKDTWQIVDAICAIIFLMYLKVNR